MKKQNLSFILVITIILLNTLAIYAIENTNEKHTLFKRYISDFYNSNNSTYKISNSKGMLVNNEFKKATATLYKNDDFDKIKKYIIDYNLKFSKIKTTEIKMRNGSIAKTKEDEFYEIMYDPEVPSSAVEVAGALRGTIYYDPNTYVITQISSPYLVFVTVSLPNKYRNTSYGSYQYSNYGANFSVRFDVYNPVPIIPYNFGTLNHDFNIIVTD